ncbi:MAG: DUF3800 domain-containing protein [Candidatus Dormibacteraeota bacterium]|nr:DUF3800 domain-containing protein [Candidatus Dormibacteraeota bacterium]
MLVNPTAYCDESGRQHLDLCVAGWLAPASEWQKPYAPWQGALQDAGLPEFKMRDCEQGQGVFKGRADREELQKRFISLINSIQSIGFVSWIDLKAFEEVAARFKDRWPQGFGKPYLLAFSMELQFMAGHVTEFIHLGPEERITFVFDRQDEFAGRALQVFNAAKADQRIQQRERLGAVTFADSARQPPLQAADLLAYEGHRYLQPLVDPALRQGRWQWQRLKDRLRVGVWDREAIQEYAQGLRLPTGDSL